MIDLFDIHVYLILLAILLDFLIGDPKWIPHPVIIIGKGISILEGVWNKGTNRKIKGLFLLISIVGGTYLFVYFVLELLALIHPILSLLFEIYFISSTVAIKGLQQAATDVLKPLKNNDLIKARKKLGYIVGRDTHDLPPPEIVRGTVETVAENTVDGVISPLFWALLGGAPLAMAYRAINTLDSMVGYRNEKFIDFGWASARCDDLANYVPARFTALFMWIFSLFVPKLKRWNALKVTFRDAKKHPSPNGGWPEAMTAGLLGVVLGGENKYEGIVSYRAEMGHFYRKLHVWDIRSTVLFMHGAWIVFVLILVCLTLI
ncbi:adenosylcobinamide-phosphate synthase [Metabacillus crassostreae]|uniref:adenosylcobinamide-phosphate synthase CbiB n=1 Tax=Metabacillus crassostreae TaxID=929098 RepID=UPI00195E2B38|nr:adenosylcobinamide-phosphate synthase CbiB [Metabacillus crassostreae]MBM7602985.1 adenosylcobinamide-phosphate synthase [Metabacillus crassostreae]